MNQRLKKTIIILLVMVLTLTGNIWNTAGQESVYAANTISTDMLNVKVQVAVDGADVIRFITSVDSLEYSKVGFELTTPSGTKTYETNTVYERIVSQVTSEEYEFSPKVVDTSSKYFVTAKFRATAGVDYTVRAFVCEKGSTEKVYGASRAVALEDAQDNVINMTVNFATTANATYDVYDGATKVGSAKVIADKNVRITLDNKEVGEFPSATRLTFKSGSTEVGTEIYRNYYTKYTGAGTEDTTWYEVDKTATSFVIASSADFYGLAKIINTKADTTAFSNDTVTLIRDITINEDMTNPKYEWDRIGVNNFGFSGVFIIKRCQKGGFNEKDIKKIKW